MTELAYMVREDWGQHGTTMAPQSAVIRRWIGLTPYVFAVTDVGKFHRAGRRSDVEVAEFLAEDESTRPTIALADLARLEYPGRAMKHAIVAVHPDGERDLEALASAVANGAVQKVFVMVWAPKDTVRAWLDGVGAVNLHTAQAITAPDPLLVEAAKEMVLEQYNGLSSGCCKDVVVGLVRAFAASGYPVETEPWMRAYFAAGGNFRHGASIARLLGEMKAGTQHRVQPRYASNIVQVLRERVEQPRSN